MMYIQGVVCPWRTQHNATMLETTTMECGSNESAEDQTTPMVCVETHQRSRAMITDIICKVRNEVDEMTSHNAHGHMHNDKCWRGAQ